MILYVWILILVLIWGYTLFIIYAIIDIMIGKYVLTKSLLFTIFTWMTQTSQVPNGPPPAVCTTLPGLKRNFRRYLSDNGDETSQVCQPNLTHLTLLGSSECPVWRTCGNPFQTREGRTDSGRRAIWHLRSLREWLSLTCLYVPTGVNPFHW